MSIIHTANTIFGGPIASDSVLVSNGTSHAQWVDSSSWKGSSGIIVKPSGEIKVANTKHSTLYVYDVRVVDLRENNELSAAELKTRVRWTMLEENIVVGPGQDVRTQILLKHAAKINEIDPDGVCTIDISYTKQWTFVSEKE